MAEQVTIEGLSFTCVPLEEANFKDIAAIYVIICINKGNTPKIIDIGQTGEAGDRFDNHKRKECWKKYCQMGKLWACLYPMPSVKFTKKERIDLERKLRTKFNPPCGKI